MDSLANNSDFSHSMRGSSYNNKPVGQNRDTLIEWSTRLFLFKMVFPSSVLSERENRHGSGQGTVRINTCANDAEHCTGNDVLLVNDP